MGGMVRDRFLRRFQGDLGGFHDRLLFNEKCCYIIGVKAESIKLPLEMLGISKCHMTRAIPPSPALSNSSPAGSTARRGPSAASAASRSLSTAAEGAHLCDIDGNRYLDYIGSWGPMILGHAHPAVVAALEAAIRRGTSFGAPTLAESELAELIIEAVPSIEKVRLVNSGTEATMSAIRLARGYTGRPMIVKFAGNYHGHVDSLLVAAGSSAATLGVPNSPGVTAGHGRDTLVLRYNDRGRPGGGVGRHGAAHRRGDRRAGRRQHGLRACHRRSFAGHCAS